MNLGIALGSAAKSGLDTYRQLNEEQRLQDDQDYRDQQRSREKNDQDAVSEGIKGPQSTGIPAGGPPGADPTAARTMQGDGASPAPVPAPAPSLPSPSGSAGPVPTGLPTQSGDAAAGVAPPSPAASPPSPPASTADNIIAAARAHGSAAALQIGMNLKNSEQVFQKNALDIDTAKKSALRQDAQDSLLRAASISESDPMRGMSMGVATLNHLDPAGVTAHFVQGPDGKPIVQVTNAAGQIVGQAADAHTFFAAALASTTPEGYQKLHEFTINSAREKAVADAQVALANAGVQRDADEHKLVPLRAAGLQAQIGATNASADASRAQAANATESTRSLAAAREVTTKQNAIELQLRQAVLSAPTPELRQQAEARRAAFDGQVGKVIPFEDGSGSKLSAMQYPDGRIEPWDKAFGGFLPPHIDYSGAQKAIIDDPHAGQPTLGKRADGQWVWTQPSVIDPHTRQPQQFKTWQQSVTAYKATRPSGAGTLGLGTGTGRGVYPQPDPSHNIIPFQQ